MRGATTIVTPLTDTAKFQSTHPMRGATKIMVKGCKYDEFQSTHPMRGATDGLISAFEFLGISIHAPHAGCDNTESRNRCTRKHFNPRTPCGVRQHLLGRQLRPGIISIHAPHAGCDYRKKHIYFYFEISIHAPHAGCDSTCSSTAWTRIYFNPRTPCGVRQRAMPSLRSPMIFQSTHPMRGATM